MYTLYNFEIGQVLMPQIIVVGAETLRGALTGCAPKRVPNPGGITGSLADNCLRLGVL